MAEFLETISGITKIVSGVIANDKDQINIGKTQIQNSVEYTESTLHLHTYVHIPTIQDFHINDPILDSYELHHGLKAKVANIFTNLVQEAMLEEIRNIDKEQFERDFRKHMDLQIFRGFVTHNVYEQVKEHVQYNRVDNAFKVIFHEISKRGKIKFLKDKQDEHIFEIRLDEIELHDDFSGVEKIFLEMFGSSNFTKTIEGAFEYMYLGSQESALLDYRIYATIRVSYGVPVIDLRVEVGGAWLQLSLGNLEFAMVQNLRSKPEVVGAEVKVALQEGQNYARVDVAVRVGM